MDYLKEKKQLLELILDNTQAQTRLIKEDDMEALEDLISQRQAIMTKVDELGQKVGPSTPGLAAQEEDSIKELLSQIITLDNANQALMKEELGQVQAELRKIRGGRQQEEHYGAEYGLYKEEGVFFDTKE